MKSKETGVMIDIGRKYFRPACLIRLIDIMAGLGLNTLMIHFSEDAGLGIDCPAYPWLAGRDAALSPQEVKGHVDESFLSVDEVRAVVAHAAGHGIDVIPSLDSPGHLNYTVKKFNDYVAEKGALDYVLDGDTYRAEFDGGYRFFKNGTLLSFPEGTADVYGISSFYVCEGAVSRVRGTRNTSVSRGFDMANPAAEAFIKSVIDSYAALFRSLGCDKIDIGGDELLGFGEAVVPTDILTRWQQLDSWKEAAVARSGKPTAVAYDLFVLYANSLKARAESLGYKSVRIWNDEFRRTCDTGWTTDPALHVQFDSDFVVQYWSTRALYESPASLAANGYRLINVDSVHSYYVLIESARKDAPESYLCVNPETIKKEWSPYTFGNITDGKPKKGYGLYSDEERSMIAGAFFCDWNDCPDLRTDDEVISELEPLLKAWASVAVYR
ncbi:MAG: family 20 glycosylhydrolase [Clostridia bacterium]|nr:family 20 glycosylhydrolase [Clostridia bacterium]